MAPPSIVPCPTPEARAVSRAIAHELAPVLERLRELRLAALEVQDRTAAAMLWRAMADVAAVQERLAAR